MRIRVMTIDDYEQVYSLWLQTPHMGLNNLDDTRESLTRYLARNPETSFVAEDEDRIIGVILGGHDGRRGFIYHAAVDKSTQRHGIGAALVDAVMEALKQEGINKVALVAYRDNQDGNAFWEKQGFATRTDLNYRNKEINEAKRIDV